VDFGRDAWLGLVLVLGTMAGDGCVDMVVSLAMVRRMSSRSYTISINSSPKRHGRIEKNKV
jgi:hypothetical protein